MDKLAEIAREFFAAIVSPGNSANWSFVRFPIPIPATHDAWVFLGIASILLAALLALLRWALSRNTKPLPQMTIEIVDDGSIGSSAEIKRSDAQQFYRVFGDPRSRQEENVTLVVKQGRRLHYASCMMRVTQSSKILPGHLRIEKKFLVEKLHIKAHDAQEQFFVDIRPASWLRSTYLSPDPNVRMQWRTGTILGFAFMAAQMAAQMALSWATT